MPAKTLRGRMASEPGAVIETIAAQEGVTPRAVIEALPEGMRRFGNGGFFADAMAAISRWGEVTLIVHTADGIFEITGAIPEGKVSRGYFNLMSRTGLHGHLRHDRCGGIAFVERPFMGKDSAFVAFLNVDGGIMFKVFVGRDAGGALQPEQLAAFQTLREAVVPEVEAT
ncbi:MAG: heme utilization cystosolic carrier protein HutX [Bauldia sp.]